MTCFWDGLIKGLVKADYKKTGIKKPFKSADSIFGYLKKNNQLTYDVKYQIGDQYVELSDQQLKENYNHIKNYKFSRDGYICSTCEPFLLLIVQLFKVRIVHEGIYHKSVYSCENYNRTLWFSSDISHFWFNG